MLWGNFCCVFEYTYMYLAKTEEKKEEKMSAMPVECRADICHVWHSTDIWIRSFKQINWQISAMSVEWVQQAGNHSFPLHRSRLG